MAKRREKCLLCKQWFKHLAEHIANMHAGEPYPKPPPKRNHHKKVEKPSPETKGKKLELKTPRQKSEEEAVKQGYHCVDCGGPLIKGQTPCPKCGATLDWRGL